MGILRSIAALALLFPAVAGSVQLDCAPRPVVVQHLLESLTTNGRPPMVAQGTRDGLLLEEWSNLSRWVRVVTTPEGVSCLVSHGLRA